MYINTQVRLSNSIIDDEHKTSILIAKMFLPNDLSSNLQTNLKQMIFNSISFHERFKKKSWNFNLRCFKKHNNIRNIIRDKRKENKNPGQTFLYNNNKNGMSIRDNTDIIIIIKK